MATSEIRTLRLERERIRARHLSGGRGTFIVRQLSDALDDAIAGVWGRIGADPGCALVALGEYGRQELSPASSLDLLVLRPSAVDPTQAAKSLSYELWGAELDLGYAVYTPEEAMRLARTRVDSELRFLDARLLVGDAGLFKSWKDDLMTWSRRSPAVFLERLVPVIMARRSSTDDACASLEPDLMDGAGGLADLATIRWIEAVGGPRELPSELGELTEAADLLHRVRNELHYLTGRCTDVFQMQYHLPVAEALMPETPEGPAGPVEVDLLRRLYESGRTIAFALDAVLDAGEQAGRADAFRHLFEDEEPVKGGHSWPAQARQAFVDLLSEGPDGRAGFRALERTGVLVDAMPEWAGIRSLPQRSAYHRHAVDVHSYEVVSELAELKASADELTRRVARDAEPDQEALLLAALIHDIGKGSEEDHCVRGEVLARSIVERIGLEEPEATDVVWLVRNHLLLSRVATRRDIGDEVMALELADRIGSERRLRLLYLLTIADARATGPAAWSTWKGTLISRLFSQVSQVLRREELAGSDAAGVVAAKMAAVRANLAGYPSGTMEQHLATMPRAWLLAQSPRGLVEQSIQMLEFRREDELAMRALADPEAGIWEVTVVANDRPGLFSRVSGVLALHGLNVLGAEAYTREDGVALEIFQVEGEIDQRMDMGALAQDARKALGGRLALDARLAELRRQRSENRVLAAGERGPQPVSAQPVSAQPVSAQPVSAQAEIEVDDEASDFFTVVEIRAMDRVGLLYTITQALVEMELDIHVAKVSTYGEEVVDVFYVRGIEGQKITDADFAAEIARAIQHRLSH